MNLLRRVRALEEMAPPSCPRRSLPRDPAAFAHGLLAGAFGPGDLDPRDPDHAGWAARVVAFLGTLQPEHQAWLRCERERDPRAHPGALLLPAGAGEIVAALDAVMRRR